MGKKKSSDRGKRVTVTQGYYYSPSDRGHGTIVGRQGHPHRPVYTVQLDSGERGTVPGSQLRNVRGRS